MKAANRGSYAGGTSGTARRAIDRIALSTRGGGEKLLQRYGQGLAGSSLHDGPCTMIAANR